MPWYSRRVPVRLADILAVQEDGSPRNPALLRDVRHALTIPYRALGTIRVMVVTAAGVPIDLTARDNDGVVYSLVVTIKRTTGDGRVVYAAAQDVPVTALPRNVRDLTLDLPPMAEPGQYVWDLWLHRGAARQPVLPTSSLTITPTVGAATPTPA